MKKKYILTFLISMFLCVGSLKAANFTFKCPTNVSKDEKISCTIETTNDKEFMGFKASIKADNFKLDKIVLDEKTCDNGSSSTGVPGNISCTASSPKTGVYKVATITGTITDNNAIIYVNGGLTNADGEYIGVASEIKNNVMLKTTTTMTTTTTKKKSSNNYLTSIKIDDEEIEGFSKDKTKYFIKVPNDTLMVDIKALQEDETATIDINGPKKLEIGDNEYTIGVTSEDNTTKFYKIIITRGEKEKSSNTKLKNIIVKDYNLPFNRKAKTFYLTVRKDVTKLDITVKTKDKNAEYEIEGNYNLEDKSVIKIKVTAENGDVDTYRIIIKKEKNNIMPVIGIASLLLIILIIVITVIVKKSSKKDNDSNKSIKNNKTQKEEPKKEEVKQKETAKPALEEKKETEVKEDDESLEKTKVMPPISPEISAGSIDNDEIEETRFINSEEQEEILDIEEEPEINLDDELSAFIDKELEKTISFKSNNN